MPKVAHFICFTGMIKTSLSLLNGTYKLWENTIKGFTLMFSNIYMQWVLYVPVTSTNNKEGAPIILDCQLQGTVLF